MRKRRSSDGRHSKPTVSRIPFLISGFLTLLAYPPVNFWPMAWFSLIPLIWAARSLNFGLAFRRGWWGGLLFNAGLLYWIALNSGAELWTAVASLLGILLVVPLYWGLFAGLWAFLCKRWGDLAVLLLPAVWVGLEVVKNAPEIGFPWQELGLTQINFLPTAQLAEFGGIRLVSAWVMTANAATFLLMVKQRKTFSYIGIILAATAIWGGWRISHLPPAGPQVQALLVQGNVDPKLKWQEDPDSSLTLYEKLTRIAVRTGKTDLVVWPETAVPVYLGHQMTYQRRLRHFAEEIGSPLLTGASHYEMKQGGGHDRYNSAFFFPADGSPPLRYDKIRLVPFGERVPFQKWFPRLGELNFGQAEFTSGRRYAVFTSGNGVKVSAQICFESVFGRETRRFVLNGARVLCNLTNDGWFGRSSGPYQHAALVRYRSIESRCPLLRAANTGITMAADRAGRVVSHLPLEKQGVLRVKVHAGGPEATFYTEHGELIPFLLSVLGLAGVLISVFKRVRRERL